MGSVTVGLGWDVDQGEVDLDVSAAPCHGKHEGNDTVDGRNSANSPVEVGSFSHYLQGLIQGLVVVWHF